MADQFYSDINESIKYAYTTKALTILRKRAKKYHNEVANSMAGNDVKKANHTSYLNILKVINNRRKQLNER